MVHALLKSAKSPVVQKLVDDGVRCIKSVGENSEALLIENETRLSVFKPWLTALKVLAYVMSGLVVGRGSDTGDFG